MNDDSRTLQESRARNFLRHGVGIAGDSSTDLKPHPRPYIPSRAWLSRTVDRYPEDGISDPDHWQGHFEGGNDDWHFDAEGTFEELVRRAVEADVAEYWVWSKAQNTFVVVEERPVTPVP